MGKFGFSTSSRDATISGFAWTPVLLLAAAMVGATALLAPEGRGDLGSLLSVAFGTGVVAGVFLLFGALLGYVHWRTASDPRQGWVLAAVVLLAGQVLVNAELTLAARLGDELAARWSLVPNLATVLLAAVACAVGLRTEAARMRDPLLVGANLVVVVVCLRLALGDVDTALPLGAAIPIGAALLLGHAIVAALVLRNSSLHVQARRRLAAAVVMIGPASAAVSLDSRFGDLASATLLSVAGIVVAHASWILLHRNIEAQRSRAASLEGSLLRVERSSRDERERLHEARSIVAGLASASQLLDSDGIPAEVRDRLEHTIRAELGRLERVVAGRTGQDVEPSTVDLDEALGAVLQLHRARGRTIEWEPTGAHVVGRLDAVAEAVNILLENAAAHGGNLGSRVAVQADPFEDIVRISVSDQGPGIPEDLRSHVFDWGVGRPDSPGQGIGLNLARRLVSEQGGSITLDQPQTQGSTFVIKLPAARRSEEYDRVDA